MKHIYKQKSLLEVEGMRATITEALHSAVSTKLHEAAKDTYGRLNNRMEHVAHVRRAYVRQAAQVTELENGDVTVKTNRAGKELFREGHSWETVKEKVRDYQRGKIVTIKIAVVDHSEIKKGKEKLKGIVEIALGFMLENCPWDKVTDDPALSLPPGLENFADPVDEKKTTPAIEVEKPEDAGPNGQKKKGATADA